MVEPEALAATAEWESDIALDDATDGSSHALLIPRSTEVCVAPLPVEQRRLLTIGSFATTVLALAVLAATSGGLRRAPWATSPHFLQQSWGLPSGGGAGCSGIGANCTHTKCCQDGRMKCYYKDPGWAECKLACSPGVNLAEPIQLRRPWSCEVAIMGVDPTWPPPRTEATTSRVPATTAPVAKPTPQSCTGLYGNCRLTQCCRDPSSKCYKRDDHWSECRQAATTIAAVQQEGTEVAPGPRPSLLCIALMLSSGMEVSLIKTQLQKGVGVFGCNGWNVYSNASVELSPGPPVRLTAEVIPGSLQCAFGHQFKIPNALNSEIFYRVWRQVIHDGHYLLYEWTVKLDPDAVVLPSRLRSHVSNRNPTDALYLNNCDEGLHGPIEVISHGGMKILANGLETCRNQLQSEWATYGEDVFMRHCFANLGLARQDDFTLLRERACRPYTWPMPCTTGAAAFHPLKTPKEYFECLQQAQR